MATQSSRFTVLIVGGAGAFGAKIAERLVRIEEIDLILAGRTVAPLEAEAAALIGGGTQRERVRIAVLDAERLTATDLSNLGARLVINASGPFQRQSYRVARAAIDAACHYVDLADARAFVAGIGELDAEARRAGVLVVSGASSVPALSSAVVAAHRSAFGRLEALDIAISPGNAFDPGVATVASVLGGVGLPIKMLIDGGWRTVHGWQGLRRTSFGEAGRRWLGYVDVPDLDLFPEQHAGLKTVRFQAGLEVSAFHLGLWASSWLVRSGLVTSLAPLAPHLLAIKRALSRFGSDRGGMIVEMRGEAPGGHPMLLRWLLVAGSGHGPYVPALASVAMARKLASGVETLRGAYPCFGLVDLSEILAEAEGLDIACRHEKRPLPH
jgi:hypothetical protein